MVGIVSGNGTGLFNTSADVLGRTDGDTGIGQAKGKAYVNTNTGNLSVQFLDEIVSAAGDDLQALRTYNSMGAMSDGDSDGWRWQGENRIQLTSGAVNTSGSTVTRTLGDGSVTLFKWDSLNNKYVSKNGSGAHDSIIWTPAEGTVGSQWTFFIDGDNVTKEYYTGSTGWIKSIRDAGNNGFNYTYSGNKLTRILDIKSLQSLEFIYGSNGKLERLDTQTTSTATSSDVLATLRQVYYGYDSSNRLTSVKVDLNPDNSSITDVYTTTYTYEAAAPNNRIASITQSDGTTASFTYHSDGKVKTVTDKAGVTTFAYLTEVVSGVTTKKTTVTNGVGNIFTYISDLNGQLLRAESIAVDTVKQSTTYTYDASGNVLTLTDGRNNVTSYSYDANGNRTQEASSEGLTVTRTFSATNRVINETHYATASTFGSDYETTRYVYDSKDRLRFTISPEGRVSEIRYGLYGLVKQAIQYVDARYSTQFLSSTTYLTESSLASWLESPSTQSSKVQLVQFEYDVRGNLTKKFAYATATASASPLVNDATEITEYVYSKHSELLITASARGADRSSRVVVSSANYDGMGRQTNLYGSDGTSSITYGSGNNAITIATGSGLSVVKATDSLGRLISVTQTGNVGDGVINDRVTSYIYDAAGRLRIQQEPSISGEAAVRSFMFYDAAGRIRQKVDATGAVIGYTYDGDGRVRSETRYATLISPTTRAAWISAETVPGAMTPVLNANNDRTTTYTYDIAGRLATTTVTGMSAIVNTYDNASRLIKTVQGDRVTKYFYDKDGLQIGILDAENFFVENIYDSVGRLIATTRYKFKTTISPQSPNSNNFGEIKANMEALYSNFPTGEEATASRKLTSFYFYDAQGRQVGVVNEMGVLTETVYDEVNNNRKTIRYLSTAPFIQDLEPVSTTTLAMARSRAINGKPNVAQTTTTNFDSLGRVSNVLTFDGTLTEYIYDASGRLIRKIDAKGSEDQRGTRTRYNAFNEVTGTVSGVGEADLATLPLDAELTTAITDYGVTYVIDRAGRKVAELGAFEAGKPQVKTFLFYNAAGQLSYSVNARGEVAKITYNTFGQTESITLYSNRISTANLGTITSGGAESTLTAKLPSANPLKDVVTTTLYNKLGLADLLTTNSQATQTKYNQYGQAYEVSETNLKDAESSSIFLAQNPADKTTVSTMQYDLLGRVVDLTRASNSINARTSTRYDGFGNVDQLIDANRNITNIYASTYFGITRDVAGRHATWTDAFGRVEQTYDGEGLLTSFNNVQYTYDDANRKITIKTGLNNGSISTWKTRTGETLKVEDGNGNVTRYTYTKDGSLDKVIKVVNGQDLVVEDNDYDHSGRLFETKDGNGVVTRYSYDAANRVIEKAIDPAGLNIRSKFEYDGAGRQLVVTEGFGSATPYVTEYIYGSNNKVKQIITGGVAAEKKSTLILDSAWTNTQVVQKGSITTSDPTTQNTLVEYDKLGRKISETADAGSGKLNLTTTYKYDANGNLTKIIDPNGAITWRVYKANLLTAEINNLGVVKEWIYDQAGRVTQSIEHRTTVSLASLGSGDTVLSTFAIPAISLDDRITRYVYSNANNKLRFTIDPRGAVTETVYDNAGNIKAFTQFSDTLQLFGDYSEGNISNTFSSDVNYHTTSYTYDSNNRVRTTTDPTGLVTTNTYDNVGNITAVTEAKDGLSRTTRFAYDANNRLRFTVDPLGGVVEQRYDSLGNIKRITKHNTPLGTLSTYSESTISGAVSATDSNNQVTLYYYDSNKNLRYIVESLTSNLVSFKENIYDVFGNITSKIQYSTSLGVDYTADYSVGDIDFNLLTRRDDPTNTKTRYAYDRDNRLRFTVDGKGVVTENTYDKAGNITATTLFNKIPNLSEGFSEANIDAKIQAGRTDSNNRTTRYAYDKYNNLRFTVDALGFVTENQYNVFGNLISIVRFSNPPNLQGNFTEANIDAVVSPTRTDTKNQTTTYNYDKAGRLSSVMNALGVMTVNNYDAFGNIIWTMEALNSTQSRDTRFAYDANNRLRYTIDALGAVSESVYDAFGNVIEKTRYAAIPDLSTGFTEARIKAKLSAADADNRTTRYVYGANNKLRFTLEAKSNTVSTITENTYDAFGNISSSIQFDKEITLGSGGNFSETNVQSLISAADRALASNRITRYAYDANGRLRFTVDAAGAVTENNYDNKGNITSTTKFGVVPDLLGDFSEKSIGDKVRLLATQDNRTATYTYDANNRIKVTTDALGFASENIYNAAGEVVDIIQHSGAVASTTIRMLVTDGASNPTTLTDIVDIQFTATRCARLTKNGELWISENSVEVKVAENVDSFQINGTRIGVLKNGTLYVYDGTVANAFTTTWDEEWAGVTSFQLEGDRIGLISNGQFRYKQGALNAIWTAFGFENVSKFQLEGVRIGLLVKSTFWINETGGTSFGNFNDIVDFQLEGNRTGILNGAGTLFIKEGVFVDGNGFDQFKEQLSNVDKFQMEGNRIAVLSDGVVYVRDAAANTLGIAKTLSSWSQKLPIEHRAASFKLAGDRIVVLTKDSQLIVKNGLTGAWNSLATGVQAYAASTHYVGTIHGLDDRITHYSYDKLGRQIKTTLPGWYDSLDGQVYSGNDGQPTRFQRTTEVTYDFMGNAVRNKIRTGLNEFVYQYKTYDNEGREIYDVDGLGYVTKKSYTLFGQLEFTTRYAAVPVAISASRAEWTSGELDAFFAIANNSSVKRTIKYEYDKVGRQKTITQPIEAGFRSEQAGSTSAILADAIENTTAPSYKAAATTVFTYNNLGDLTKQSQLISNTAARDSAGNVIGKWADTYHYYDKLGRKELVVDAEKYGTKIEYDKLGDVNKTTEYANRGTGTLNSTTTRPTYTLRNAAEVSNRDRITQFTYDNMGRVRTTSKRLTGDTYTQIDEKIYNAFGEITDSKAFNAADALSNVTTMKYNRLGQVTEVIEPARNVGGAGKDVFKDQAAVRPVTSFIYNAFGENISQARRADIEASSSVTVKHKFDFAGNEVETIDALGNSITMEYDVTGHMVAQKQLVKVAVNSSSGMDYSHLIERRFEYDAAGRQTATMDLYKDSGGNLQKTGQANEYNGFGEVVNEYKIWGGAGERTSNLLTNDLSRVLLNSYTYDNAGHVKAKTSGDGFTRFYYDLAGNVTRKEVREEDNNTTSQRVTEIYYDLLGRVLTQRLPKFSSTATHLLPTDTLATAKTPTIIHTVDRWGNVLTAKDPAGETTTYTYNGNNQLLTEVGPAVSAIRYVADEAAAVYTAAVKHSFVYDLSGRVKTESFTDSDNNVRSTQTFYNDVGQLIDTYKTGPTTILTNPLGDIIGFFTLKMERQEFVYDSSGNRIGNRDAFGHVTLDTFDKNNQLTKHVLLRNGAKDEYVGTDNGNLTEITLAHYSYDQAGRAYAAYDAVLVPGPTGHESNREAYKFDERGNIVAMSDREFNRKYYDFDEMGNQISEQTKNGDGSVLVSTEWSFKQANGDFLDYASQRAVSRSAGGVTYSYGYSGFGELKTEIFNGQRSATKTSLSMISYLYWENGLQQSVREVTIETDTANGALFASTTPITTTSESLNKTWYDIKSNHTIEYSQSSKTVNPYTMSLGQLGNHEVPTSTISSGDIYTYYQYDALNRLSKVNSPSVLATPAGAGKDILGGAIQSNKVFTTNLKSLTYHYDEFGNRRKITSKYMLPSPLTNLNHEEKTVTEWYAYDNANRVTVEGGILDATNKTAVAFRTLDQKKAVGIVYSYDDAGRRSSEEKWDSIDERLTKNTEKYNKFLYTYNDLGLVSDIKKLTYSRLSRDLGDASITMSNGYSNGIVSATKVAADYENVAGRGIIEHNEYDNRGFKAITILGDEENRTIVNTYYKNGSLDLQVTSETSTGNVESTSKYEYDAGGNTTLSTATSFDLDDGDEKSKSIYSYVYTNTYRGLQASRINLDAKSDASTRNTYDIRGRLIHSDGSNKNMKERVYFYNSTGQIITRAERKATTQDVFAVQSYYYSGAGELASIGNVDDVNISPLTAVNAGGGAPGSYTISEGDTLMGIAQAMFGDTRLWYVIADANGLNMGPTQEFIVSDVGRNLTIPNNDKTVRNTSSNLKPYNASETAGDLTPVMPPPKKKGCNGIAAIIMVVVAVIVTIYTAGAAAAYFASMGGTVLGTGFAAGTTALMGGVAGASATVVAASVAGAVVGGFVGSVASQLVGKALGVVEHFSLRQAVSTGLTAGFTAGAGAYLSTLSSGTLLVDKVATAKNAIQLTKIGYMAQGAAAYLGAYASNRIAGLNDMHFNWKDIAAASAASVLNSATSGSVSSNVAEFAKNDFIGQVAGNMWNSTVSSSLNRLTGRGAEQDWGAMAADAFGNASASYVVGKLAAPKSALPTLRQTTQKEFDQMGAAWDAEVRANGEKLSDPEDLFGPLAGLPEIVIEGGAKVISPKDSALLAKNNAPQTTGPIDEYVLTAYADGSESTWEFNPPTDWSNLEDDIKTINYSSAKDDLRVLRAALPPLALLDPDLWRAGYNSMLKAGASFIANAPTHNSMYGPSFDDSLYISPQQRAANEKGMVDAGMWNYSDPTMGDIYESSISGASFLTPLGAEKAAVYTGSVIGRMDGVVGVTNSAIPSYDELIGLASRDLDFSTKKNGAIFWSTSSDQRVNNMLTAQWYGDLTGKTTLEQTVGGRYLASLKLFDNMDGPQAAHIWDIASARFANGASGNINVFNKGAQQYGQYGERTWWSVEKPLLDLNSNVKNVREWNWTTKPENLPKLK